MKKKLLSLLLALCFVMALVPMTAFAEGTSVDNWDGTADTSWYTDHKTDTEYHFTTAEQLAGLAQLVNDKTASVSFEGKTIYLDNDLDLSGSQWTPIGNGSNFGRYFEGKKPQISELPLAPIGGEFRQTVWKMLTEIPYGKVITYGELAQKIAKQRGIERMSAQAVGGAVGHNPISIIIPCHRVVGANGNLTGFSGGIQMKLQLLQHEGVDINRFYIPTKGTAL